MARADAKLGRGTGGHWERRHVAELARTQAVLPTRNERHQSKPKESFADVTSDIRLTATGHLPQSDASSRVWPSGGGHESIDVSVEERQIRPPRDVIPDTLR
jgi:hypothetical protein